MYTLTRGKNKDAHLLFATKGGLYLKQYQTIDIASKTEAL